MNAGVEYRTIAILRELLFELEVEAELDHELLRELVDRDIERHWHRVTSLRIAIGQRARDLRLSPEQVIDDALVAGVVLAFADRLRPQSFRLGSGEGSRWYHNVVPGADLSDPEVALWLRRAAQREAVVDLIGHPLREEQLAALFDEEGEPQD